ncbi:MAG: NAD(P)/FAD-dependent oxidoreductase [Candidatus Latescibacteria bacterium]|nr:NAD(P)/FAD-dependent oxidoreductase [Candidatus Latescibacterota bacterium]
MKKETLKNDIIVIGGGPAGVEAAIAAAPYADSVVIISEGPVGDWGKLMPSRVWLTALDQMEIMEQSPLLRTTSKAGAFDLDLIATHTDRVASSWKNYVTQELNQKRIQISIGRASFTSPNQVQITSNTGRRELAANAIIIASGAIPNFPSGFEPDGERVFSPSTIDQMKTLPKSIIVVGDGPIGFEFVEIFSRLGVHITWIVLAGGPRSGFGTEADEFLIRPDHLLRALNAVMMRYR